MKWFLKWTLRLVFLAVVAVVLLLVFKNTILRMVAEHQIRAETGMDEDRPLLLRPVLASGDHRKSEALQHAGIRWHRIPHHSRIAYRVRC